MAQFEVNFILVSDSAIIAQDGRLSIINIFENINTSNLPAIHPQMCVVGSIAYAGAIKNRPESFNLEVSIKSPKGDEVFTASQRLPLSDSNSGFVFQIQGVQFSEEGEHEISINSDNTKIGESAVNLVLSKG